MMSQTKYEIIRSAILRSRAVVEATTTLSKLANKLGMIPSEVLESAYILGGSLTRRLEEYILLGTDLSDGGDIDISLTDPDKLYEVLDNLLVRFSNQSIVVNKSLMSHGTYLVRLERRSTQSAVVVKYDIYTDQLEIATSHNDRSLLIITNSEVESSRDIQVVLEVIQPNVVDALDLIDFGVCKIGVTLGEVPLIITRSTTSDHDDAIEEIIEQIINKELVYDPESRDPVNSLTRLFRYISSDRGYHISGYNMSKLLSRVQEEDPHHSDLLGYVRVDSSGASRDEDNPDSSGY